MKKTLTLLFIFLCVVILFSCSREELNYIINGNNIQAIFGQWKATSDGPYYIFEKEEGVLMFAYKENNSVPFVECGNFTAEGSQIVLHTTMLDFLGYPPTYVDTYRTIICYRRGSNLVIDGVVFTQY